MKKMLLFLDVDGVLNNHNEIYMIQSHNREVKKKREENGYYDGETDCLKKKDFRCNQLSYNGFR